MSPKWAFLAHFGDISYNVFNRRISLLLNMIKLLLNMIFYHVLSEAILYQRKPLDLSNPLINCQYLEKLVCQVLVLQSIQLHLRQADDVSLGRIESQEES